MSEWLFPMRKLLFRRRSEESLSGEIRFHIERETAENIRRGMSPEAALRKARLEFGAVPATQEECRESWGWLFLDSLRRDIAYAIRTLRKDYVYTLVAVLTLALGIGSNTALFSVLRGIVFQPLPIRDDQRVVLLDRLDIKSRQSTLGFSFLEMQQIRDQSKSLEDIAEFHTMSFILLGRSEPQKVDTAVVGANYFDFFGIKPLYGRAFLPGEDKHGADGVLVLSHRYFLQNFGGDPKIVGTTVRLNDRVHTIVGILPPLPEFPARIDVYMPTSSCPARSSQQFESNPRFTLISLYGRLRPGASIEQAQVEFETIIARFRADHPDVYPPSVQWTPRVLSLRDELARTAKPTFLVLFAITGLVLLIACASVANLSLARALRRRREIAIRSAIGGSRSRLVQQFLVEGLLVSLAGGALGLASAQAVLSLLKTFAARFSVRSSQIQLDLPVLAFCIAVSLLTGIVFCGLPAWRARGDLISALKDRLAGSSTVPGAGYARRVLVGSQVAFSLLVLMAAGLLLRSFLRLSQVQLGFQPEHVVSLQIRPNFTHNSSQGAYIRTMRNVLAQARNVPGVTSAALTARTPLAEGAALNRGLIFEGQAVDPSTPLTVVSFSAATPQYFDTLKIPVIRGRDFRDADDVDDAPPVALVNETMARRRWPNQDPIGHRIQIPGQNARWITVVGICGDVRAFTLDQEPGEQVYLPISVLSSASNLLVRTNADPGSVIASLRRAVYAADPEQAIANVRTMQEILSDQLSAPQLTLKLTGILALLTLLITIAGIGGVAAASASNRKTEIGIRMALGALPTRLVGMMVRQELVMVAAGLAAGLAAGFVFTRLLAKLLFQTEPNDPFALASAAALMLVAAAIACLLPAMRAVRVDPLETLRSE